MNNSVKIWISRILTGFVTFALVASAFAKVAHVPRMVDGLTKAGIPESAVVPLAILELACLSLYLIPRTTILGAVLLTGYFGGAIVVHLIGGQPLAPVILLGVFVWGGIYFRIPVLQSLLPFRKQLPENGHEAAMSMVSMAGNRA